MVTTNFYINDDNCLVSEGNAQKHNLLKFRTFCFIFFVQFVSLWKYMEIDNEHNMKYS